MVSTAERELAAEEEAEAMQDFTEKLMANEESEMQDYFVNKRKEEIRKEIIEFFVPITFDNIAQARKALRELKKKNKSTFFAKLVVSLDNKTLKTMAQELEAKINTYEEYVERDTRQAFEGKGGEKNDKRCG